MKDIDRPELNNASIVAYALSMAIFSALDEATKQRVKASVLSFLPPAPDPAEAQPADLEMWRRAHTELKTLAGQ
jgi:hypothetical protein